MFCLYCGGSISPSNDVCPDCGKHLDEHSRVLNPVPRKIIEVSADAEETTVALTEPPASAKEPEGYVVEDINATSTTPQEESVVMQFNYKETGAACAAPPTSESDFLGGTPVAPPASESDLPSGNATTEQEVAKPHKLPVVLVILLFAVLVVLTIALLRHRAKPSVDEITNSATDNVATADAVASNSDAANRVLASSDLDLQPDTLIGKKDIVINENSYSSEDLVHLTDTANGVDITECHYTLTADEAQRYVDEQEVLYQLQEASISEVVYLDGVYRYHYVDVYQYGYYCDSCLYIYEINDSLDVASCDNLALEYFNKEVLNNAQ